MVKSLDLQKSRKNFYSQDGEDGIISKIFDVLKIKNGWCVEFGAWDGIHLSNTYHLIVDKKWRGVLIEGNRSRYLQMTKNLSGQSAVCINSFVAANGSNSLDMLLFRTSIPKDFELLSIDIDGNDYHIWKGLKKYKPKVVIIEFNPTIPLEVEFVQEYNPNINHGSSLSALNKLAKSKKYSLVATTSANAIFVSNRLLARLGVISTDPTIIWTGRKDSLTYFFQLYDGTIGIQGSRILRWHGIYIENKNMQLIPKIFRHFPPTLFDKMGSLIYLGNWKQIQRGLSNHFKRSK
jgi:hypothetical protein